MIQFVGGMAAATAVYGIWQYYELQQFRVTNYQICSKKIQTPMRVMLLSDLHCHTFGKENQRLLSAIREQKPDLIVIPGDLIMDKHPEKFSFASEFIQSIQGICPIYFSRGNHEGRVCLEPESEKGEAYLAVEEKMRLAGCHILSNEREEIEIKGNRLTMYGLELAKEYYKKGKKITMADDVVQSYLGKPETKRFGILLAHNSAFSEQYAAWGADLSVCGHNHGGLVCIPGIGSVISPQFEFFPKYAFGQHEIKGKQVVISRGLGTHTFHIRIFNRAEVVCIDLLPS
ncbi:MAG: metallophosphoesterase [Lachnospiraceae bacterium]